jgi:hypothetical protein
MSGYGAVTVKNVKVCWLDSALLDLFASISIETYSFYNISVTIVEAHSKVFTAVAQKEVQ